MTIVHTVLNKQCQYLEQIKPLTLLDDQFMSKVFEDVSCVNYLLSTLSPYIRDIVECRGQHKINNLQGRSVILDLYIIDADDRHFNIEVQRANSGAVPQRARLHMSLINGNIIFKNEEFKDLPRVCVIFICEHDVFKKGKPVYHIKRVIKETGEEFDDGEELIYVNGEIDDDGTKEGRMMHDFKCPDPNEMYSEALQKRVRYLKETKEGLEEMSEVFEKIREKGRKEGFDDGRTLGIEIGEQNKMYEIAKKMYNSAKYKIEDIVFATGMSEKEIKELCIA